MEIHATAERRALADLEREDEQPIRLPSPDELLARLWDLDENLREDPIAGRERLKRFIDEEIRLVLGEDGIFTARTTIFPLMLLTPETRKPAPSPRGRP
jgi:hypothetical protein